VNIGVWFDLRNPPGWRQDPARLAAFTLELCEEAELLGADSLWFSEHHGFEDGYLPQPLTFAAAAAARTTRVRLGTGILVAPLRKTAQLAEEAAVVDLISGGRLELGLGAGYRVPEFELFGTDFAARYQILDQQVSELRRLWGDALSSYKGEFVNFENVRSFPKPVHGADLPVFFGGESGPALRRVAEYGNGWCGFNLSPAEAADKMKHLDQLIKAAGRKRSEIYVALSPYAKPITQDDLKRYRDAGVDELGLLDFNPPASERDLIAKMEQMAREWVEPAAKI